MGTVLLCTMRHVDFGWTSHLTAEEWTGLLIFPAASVVGMFLAWRWEGLGGVINAGFFLANLGLYWVLREKFFPLKALAIFSPVLITGMLFLVCWWRSRPRVSANSA